MKKREKIVAKIKEHSEQHLYARITRFSDKKNKDTEVVRGYIVDYSETFILLKIEEDFLFFGYEVIPVKYIKDIRYNENDQYVDYINKSEYPKEEFELDKNLKIDLSDWVTLFQSLKNAEKVIISECEKRKHNYFAIGSIHHADDEFVYINYLDAQGRLDKEPVDHKFKWITKVTFDDNYSKVFSKYTRE